MTDSEYSIPNDDDISPDETKPNADLSDAFLREADLSGALLLGADLSDADLIDADLSNTLLVDTDFSQVALSRQTTIGSPRKRVQAENEEMGEREYDQIARANHELWTASARTD